MPGPTHHDPHEIGVVRQRHEVDNRRAAGVGLKFGFEDEGAGAITPANCENRLLRSKQPTTILDCSKQSGEASRRIEAGPAQPIDRAVEADQSRCLAVADQRILFDAKGHCL
jgi:hypothetical protein